MCISKSRMLAALVVSKGQLEFLRPQIAVGRALLSNRSDAGVLVDLGSDKELLG
jgi:hypothetical protein